MTLVISFTAPRNINISVQTDLLPNQTSLFSALVSWTKPNNTIFAVTKYNILLYDFHTYINTFGFEQMSNDTRSVILSPLNKSMEYNIYVSQRSFFSARYMLRRSNLLYFWHEKESMQWVVFFVLLHIVWKKTGA